MKLILLSLLPLAVDLACARPAHQEDVAALTKRTAQAEVADFSTDSSSATDSEVPTDSLFSLSPGILSDPSSTTSENYPHVLSENFASGSAKTFLGLSDEEAAQLQDIFTGDGQDLKLGFNPDDKLDSTYDYETAFASDGDSGTSGSVKAEDSKDEGKPVFSTIPPPIAVNPPAFDPKSTDLFDENGLPTVTFKSGDDYSLSISVPLPSATPDPHGDYSQFTTPKRQ